jgi:pyruvate dehydrogenase (quinone)
VHCDPDVPPIPPHATLEQMTNLAKALAKGDASRWGVIKEGIRAKAREVLS